MNIRNLPDRVRDHITARAEAAKAALNAEGHLLDELERWYCDAAGDFYEAMTAKEAKLREGGAVEGEMAELGAAVEDARAEARGRLDDVQEQRERLRLARINCEYADLLASNLTDEPPF